MVVAQELVAKFKAETSQFERKVQVVQQELRETGSAVQQASAETKRFERASSTASQSVANNYKAIGLAVQQASAETTRFERASSAASQSIANNYKAIGLAVGAAAVAVAAFSVKVGSEMQAAQKRIEGMLGSTEDAARVMSNLRAVGQETGASVAALAQGYGKLAVFVDNGTISLEESLEISKGLSSTTIALGASTEQLNQVLFGFSQAMGSGTVRAEEFNQVTEPLPGIINRIEEAAGLAAGELRQMINDGEVTSEMFKELLIPALQSFEGQAKQMIDTFQAQSGILSNTLADIGSDIFDFLEEPLIDATVAANKFLQTFLSVERASNSELQRRIDENIAEMSELHRLGKQMFGALARPQIAELQKETNILIEQLQLRQESIDVAEKKEKTETDVLKEKIKLLKEEIELKKKNKGGKKEGSGTKRKGTSRSSKTKEKPIHEQMAGLGIDSEFELLATKDSVVDDFKSNAQEIHTEIDLMQGAFDQMSTSMLSSFMAMSQGSRTSFKDMARSIINDMQAVIVKALIMRAISGITGAMGGAPVATPATGTATGAPMSIIPNLSGARASGGSVGAGRSYLVGEKGPEILTMGQASGFVHSNQDSFGGGGSQIINIDARGASKGVEQEIRRVMQDVSQLRRQVPNIAISAVREQNSRKPDFLR